tara:strand:+ start:801 stop:1031 length:231 start_codon:yes stop_codon:yes gene_type:complete
MDIDFSGAYIVDGGSGFSSIRERSLAKLEMQETRTACPNAMQPRTSRLVDLPVLVTLISKYIYKQKQYAKDQIQVS